jgi:two-component system OmpR family response regulator
MLTLVRVLVVEDEVKLAVIVRRALRESGHEADVAVRGEDALWMAARTRYDAVVLDVLLPGIDGVETCRRLRAQGLDAFVLMLTARGQIGDRVIGLDAGADDYVVKPFALAELLARLRAQQRRAAGPARPDRQTLQAGGLRLDEQSRRVWRGDSEIDLSRREYALLEVLMRDPETVLTRVELLERAWEAGADLSSNVVDVYVRYLREKVDRPFGASSVETVRGFGYRLRESPPG